jgi:hypothetical protein
VRARRGRPAYRQELFFCRALLGEGGGYFSLFNARRRVAALTKILLFGAITHHAGMHNLSLLLGPVSGRGFIRHTKYSVREALLSIRLL